MAAPWSLNSTIEETTKEIVDFEAGKDAIIVILDARANMFVKNSKGEVYFDNCLKVIQEMLKANIIANTKQMIGVVLCGTKIRENVNDFEGVYELQSLDGPVAERIKQIENLKDGGFARTIGSQADTAEFPLSNTLWHCGISFSNANLKPYDTQRVWIFTNDDNPNANDKESRARIIQQATDHHELNREINLYYCDRRDHQFQLDKFYKQMLSCFDDDKTGSVVAFPFRQDLFDYVRRRQFRKRRYTSLNLQISKDVAIGVDLFVMIMPQKKTSPMFLEGKTNTPLRVESKWLCAGTGAHLSQEQIRTYIPHGGKRSYFSQDDKAEVSYVGEAGIDLFGFKPLSFLQDIDNLRPPYFLYPHERGIQGSINAFVAIHGAMLAKKAMGIARFISRRGVPPKLVALIAQKEANDEFGQISPPGINMIFLPFADDVRSLRVEPQSEASEDQINAARKLVNTINITNFSVTEFENPVLQKHYSAIQALALEEDTLEYDESMDSLCPDDDAFNNSKCQEVILAFKDSCGGDRLVEEDKKRKTDSRSNSKSISAKSTSAKSKATTTKVVSVADDLTSMEFWKQIVNSNALQKRTVKDMKEFLVAHNLPLEGKKQELADRITAFISWKQRKAK